MSRSNPTPAEVLSALNPKKLLIGLAVLLLGALIYTGVYTVPMDSVAVVTRFGSYLDAVGPGLQFKLPWGIDTAEIVATERIMKLEFGYGTEGATNPYQYKYDERDRDSEKNMVTGDLNAVEVEWVVQYRVSDPKAYLFHFNDPTETLRDLSESVMREVVGDRTVDEVLTIGRAEMEAETQRRLSESVHKLEMGFEINQVQLGSVGPPPPVKDSFDEVNRAQQEKEQAINQANGEYNRVVPKASGEAEQKISTAEGYATQRVNEAEGNAARFNALLAEYQKAPEVTKKRIYLETMQEILAATPNKIIIDEKTPPMLAPQLFRSLASPQTLPAQPR
ncbi:MAG: FtsH protease activity modulator HflK [Verrucomicrobiaceae bacterium]|nr:FtsH protease activity modulator HflK [Verrucomicrobiaceae bacterium]